MNSFTFNLIWVDILRMHSRLLCIHHQTDSSLDPTIIFLFPHHLFGPFCGLLLSDLDPSYYLVPPPYVISLDYTVLHDTMFEEFLYIALMISLRK